MFLTITDIFKFLLEDEKLDCDVEAIIETIKGMSPLVLKIYLWYSKGMLAREYNMLHCPGVCYFTVGLSFRMIIHQAAQYPA